MKRIDTTWRALQAGVPVATDEQHVFVVQRNYAEVLELGARMFLPGSSVLLPMPDERAAGKDRALLGWSGLSTLAHALRYAKAHADRKLCVFAHDDDADVGRARVAAERRAQNVHALLTGDHAAFAASCFYVGADTPRALLRFAHQRHGYACAPGEDLSAAVARFRSAHNARTGTTLSGGGSLTAQDLEAFAALYDASLAELLEVEPAELSSYRSALKLTDPPYLGCGNRWPSPTGRDTAEMRDRSTRRVDLTFFETATPLPDLHAKPAGAQVYADQRYARCIYVPPEPPPAVTCVRMSGMYFDTNKCFLLPSAMRGLRKLVALYEEHPKGELLVVGHTDTAGRDSYNEQLSLERAKAVAAFLKDDVDAWLAWYGDDKPTLKRWGSAEDLAMLGALPDGATHTGATHPIKSYQASRGLKDDGIAGKNTRTQLIKDYMALDGTTLPASLTPVAHGCGEAFPAVETDDDVAQDENRRVELFLFDEGIDPKPGGETSKAGSAEYGKWRAKVVRQTDLSAADRIALELFLLNGIGEPMPGAQYQVLDASGVALDAGHADDSGFVSTEVPAAETLVVAWGHPGAPTPYYRQTFVPVGTPEAISDELRLRHLGYEGPVPEAVRAFQLDFRLEPTGRLDDIRASLRRWHDQGVLPQQGGAPIDADKTTPPAFDPEYAALICDDEAQATAFA